MFRRKTLLIAIVVIIFLTSCGTQAPTATPTPAFYVPEGTPGVKPEVEIILPDPIPCEKVGNSDCKYNYRIKLKETNGASVLISSLCRTFTDAGGQVWSQSGLDGCFDTFIVIPPGGIAEYDRDMYVMGVLGGKLNVKAHIRFIFEQSTTYTYAVKSVQLAWPNWATPPK